MDTSGTIVFTGGSGFLAVRTAERILATDPNAKILLTDIAHHARLERLGERVAFKQADLSTAEACRATIPSDATAVFHFASLVSGGAEKDFDAGMRANVHLTLHLLEACRATGNTPRFIFTSSIATYGGAKLPDEIDDWTHQHPQNSYGVAKVLGEQLLNDYTRKGFLDGRAVRLPAIVVRDEANTAASGYASAIIREPLQGRDYICPVAREDRIPIMSIEVCVDLLIALAELEPNALGDFRALNGPGISPSAGEMADAVDALRAGDGLIGKIEFAPQPEIRNIISAWPKVMHAPRARALGLPGEKGIEDILARYRANL